MRFAKPPTRGNIVAFVSAFRQGASGNAMCTKKNSVGISSDAIFGAQDDIRKRQFRGYSESPENRAFIDILQR